jgi:hypothetical protein
MMTDQEFIERMERGHEAIRSRLTDLSVGQLADLLVTLLQNNAQQIFKPDCCPTLAEDRATVAALPPDAVYGYIAEHLAANPEDWRFVPERVE